VTDTSLVSFSGSQFVTINRFKAETMIDRRLTMAAAPQINTESDKRMENSVRSMNTYLFLFGRRPRPTFKGFDLMRLPILARPLYSQFFKTDATFVTQTKKFTWNKLNANFGPPSS
jgi:hypothetical protein